MPSDSIESQDLLVIGGGIHGAGVAQAAAAAGYSVTLLERRELAAGTSSRSSKLIHGGLRYLESGQWRLVRESLRERALLLRNAPELVRLVPFTIPIYRRTTRRPWEIRAGLSLYALLGGMSEEARFRKLPRAEWDGLDGLTTDGLQAVFRYHDGQTDDAALTRGVVASAERLGARTLVGAEVLRVERAGGGWELRYSQGGREERLRGRALANAAGPWVDRVLDLFDPPVPRVAVELVAGAHVEMPGRIEGGVYYCEAPTDRRAVFVMPWRDRTLVGTTEVPWSGDPEGVKPSRSEVFYLRQTFERYFPGRAADHLDAWAGLRVLPRGAQPAFHRPREVILHPDLPRRPQLVTVYGGKLTGYRATAERVVELLAPALPHRPRKARTEGLRITPADAPALA